MSQAGKNAGAQALATPTNPAEEAERMRTALRNFGDSSYLKALSEAENSPVAKLLDELALKDLVRVEVYMSQYKDVPRFRNNEHARQTWECIKSVRSATDSMRANHWLRRAMVHSKDFMLWDDAVFGEQVRADRAKGGKGKPSKLPSAEVLHAELNHRVVAREMTEKQAKSVLRQMYGVTSQGLNAKLRKVKVA